jgi:hypothetical protein
MNTPGTYAGKSIIQIERRSNMNRTRITKKIMSVTILALIAGVAMAASGSAWARSKGLRVGDPTPFSTCTKLNGTNVLFELTADITATVANITATGTSACITLGGDHNGLFLNGHTITGPGSGAGAYTGIDITANHTMMEGLNATVIGFRVGIADTADRTFGDDFNVEGNGTGLKLTGHHERWYNFFASSPSETRPDPLSNGTGVLVEGCVDSCSIANFDASGNTGDGVDVQESDSTAVELFVASNNGGDGVHLGGPSTGDGNNDVRVANAFFGDGVANWVSGNGDDGVFLDSSEAGSRDQVTVVRASGNANFDLEDETTNCGGGSSFNLWYGNSFGTSSPGFSASTACID